MMEVVRAELRCVHSRMEYIKMKLQEHKTGNERALPDMYDGRSRTSTLPHDTGEHKLHNKQGIGPAFILQTLFTHTHTHTVTHLTVASCRAVCSRTYRLQVS